MPVVERDTSRMPSWPAAARSTTGTRATANVTRAAHNPHAGLGRHRSHSHLRARLNARTRSKSAPTSAALCIFQEEDRAVGRDPSRLENTRSPAAPDVHDRRLIERTAASRLLHTSMCRSIARPASERHHVCTTSHGDRASNPVFRFAGGGGRHSSKTGVMPSLTCSDLRLWIACG
jgi:hypothetical protein